jgi:hypothetical protein
MVGNRGKQPSMTRFYDSDEGVPWPLWKSILSNALGGKRGQRALADMEAALLALPERKLIDGDPCLGGCCLRRGRVRRSQARPA